MSDSERDEWRARFRAVSRAQSRYLYLLLLSGVFFWALRTGSIPFDEHSPSRYARVPVLGVALDPRVILDCGPIVLGLLVHALLGTFPALNYATERLGLKNDDDFQRLDDVPNAIDFVVFVRDGSSVLGRLGLLSYPLVISIAFLEGFWLAAESGAVYPGDTVNRLFAATGALVLLLALPRFAAFAVSKAQKMMRT